VGSFGLFLPPSQFPLLLLLFGFLVLEFFLLFSFLGVVLDWNSAVIFFLLHEVGFNFFLILDLLELIYIFLDIGPENDEISDEILMITPQIL
jgi:hypothetical protein